MPWAAAALGCVRWVPLSPWVRARGPAQQAVACLDCRKGLNREQSRGTSTARYRRSPGMSLQPATRRPGSRPFPTTRPAWAARRRRGPLCRLRALRSPERRSTRPPATGPPTGRLQRRPPTTPRPTATRRGAPPYGPPSYGPPSGPPSYGAPGQPPPQKSRKALWIVLGIVGGVLLLVAAGAAPPSWSAWWAEPPTRPGARGRIHEADHRRRGQHRLREVPGPGPHAEDFPGGVRRRGAEPGAGRQLQTYFSSLKVSSNNGANAADVAGSIDCATKQVELAYRFEGRDELKMVNIRLRPER